jgi:cytochrome P450
MRAGVPEHPVRPTGEPSVEPLYDPQDPAFQANPYPIYARMREAGPVQFRLFPQPDGRQVPVWVLTRWEDCVSVLRDPRFSARKNFLELITGPAAQVAELQPLVRTYQGMMLFLDPPDHTRLRNLVNKGFTPRRVQHLRPRIEAIVGQLVEAAAARGRMDVIADLAVPLPIIVIAELLGVPVEDRGRLKVLSDHAAMLLDGTLRDEHLAVALPNFVELVQYLKGIIEARRKEPQDDLISALVAAQDAADALDDYEVLGTCTLILAAGHETTTNLIGNGMAALLRDPAAFARLGREPGLLPSAVDELLRYDSPVQVTSRVPLEDVEIQGVRIPQGDEVNTLIGSANRDPAQFPDPDRLVLDRPDNRHLSFGHGAHFCLGAPLARLEGEIAIRELTQRFPEMRLAVEDPPRRAGFVLRGWQALPVALT